MQKLLKLIGFTVLLSTSAWAVAQSNASIAVPPEVQGKATPRADNTEMNTRDKSGMTQTPQKQTNRKQDRKMLAAVRRAIFADKTLSMSAHNVKIVTQDGVVTLRGPVKNEIEKSKIEVIVKQVTGVTNVVNQLDIKTH